MDLPSWALRSLVVSVFPVPAGPAGAVPMHSQQACMSQALAREREEHLGATAPFTSHVNPLEKPYGNHDHIMWNVPHLPPDFCSLCGSKPYPTASLQRKGRSYLGRRDVDAICEWGNDKTWSIAQVLVPAEEITHPRIVRLGEWREPHDLRVPVLPLSLCLMGMSCPSAVHFFLPRLPCRPSNIVELHCRTSRPL